MGLRPLVSRCSGVKFCNTNMTSCRSAVVMNDDAKQQDDRVCCGLRLGTGNRLWLMGIVPREGSALTLFAAVTRDSRCDSGVDCNRNNTDCTAIASRGSAGLGNEVSDFHHRRE